MCGRYFVDDVVFSEIEKIVPAICADIQKQQAGDIYPSRKALVLTGTGQGLSAEEMLWGFPGYYQKGLLINARAETVLERKTFRDSVLHRRCIIPAGHFYEWDSGKNKATFLSKDGTVLYMAGCYRRFENEDRFVIITTQANDSVSRVHDRMPLILEKDELEAWLYDDHFLNFALNKTPVELEKRQEYEQLSLF